MRTIPSYLRLIHMRVLFLTIDELEQRNGKAYSSNASTRWTVIYPDEWLRARGYETRILSISCEAEAAVRDAARAADRIILGKLLRRPDEAEPFLHQVGLYLKLLSDTILRQRKAVMIVGDDVFQLAQFRRFVAEGGERLLAWYAASEEIAARIAALSDRPIFVVPECYEFSHREPDAPKLALPRRAVLAWARFTGGSRDAARVRLLWFGHPSNIGGLRNALTDLYEYGKKVPLHVHCVSSPGFGLEALARLAELITADTPMRLSFEPWSIETLDRALGECDMVIIPYDMRDQTKIVKSNNRMIAALRAGRLALANPIPSFHSIANFAWVGEPLSAGIQWALDNRAQALGRVVAGQKYVETHHAPEVITDHWERLLQVDE